VGGRPYGNKNHYIHGKRKTRLYRIWANIKTRCTNTNDPHFDRYGGRGITICDEWKNDFKAFYDWSMSNGYADDLTIDRIDNNGNYEPSNCRWVTVAEQNRNKRNVKYITYNGETHTISEWTDILHLGKETIRERLKRGWSETEAITGKRVM
jgi:hypothetical protein